MRAQAPSTTTLKKFDITKKEWLALWEEQDGQCALCLKNFTANRRACVDHNHLTGEVRGLLCSPCNYELGCLHDNAGWLARAAQYLTISTARKVFGHVVPVVPRKNRSKA